MKKFFLSFALLIGMVAINAQTRTIYLDATLWNVDSPVYAVHVWNTGDEDAADAWFQPVEGQNGIFVAEIREDAAHAIFCRKNPNDAEVMTNVWGGWWNRAYTDIPADKNLFTITAWEGGEGENQSLGSWSVYGEEPAAPADVIVKVLKPAAWNSIYLWGWGSADATFMAQFAQWPGVPAQDLGNGWFQVTVKEDAWFKFNSGPGEPLLESTAAHCTAAHCFTISDQSQLGGQGQNEYILVDADCDDMPSAVENVTEEAKTAKRIVNGQLIILHDGKTFNALGTELR